MYTMKRILFLIMTMALVAVGCNKELGLLSVTPTSLEFSGEEGSQTVSVTIGEGATWVVKVDPAAASWLST
jgi:hypothetical protein